MAIFKRREFGSPEQWSGRDKDLIFHCLGEIAFNDPDIAVACINIWAGSKKPAARLMAVYLIGDLELFRAIGEMEIPELPEGIAEQLGSDPDPSVSRVAKMLLLPQDEVLHPVEGMRSD